MAHLQCTTAGGSTDGKHLDHGREPGGKQVCFSTQAHQHSLNWPSPLRRNTPLFSNSRRHAGLEHITVEAERDRALHLFAHIAGLLSDQAQPVRPSHELSRRFFSLLSIAHHHERVVAKNGAQFRRMMDDEWDAQTSKHACHPGEIFHFTADEYSIVLLFKMPL